MKLELAVLNIELLCLIEQQSKLFLLKFFNCFSKNVLKAKVRTKFRTLKSFVAKILGDLVSLM